MNISTVSLEKTARTRYVIAEQRANNLKELCNPRSVLELCVGPSLAPLSVAYAQHGITCIGNDIDNRWQKYYPQGLWRMGNCFDISWSDVDVVVFAPPLSKGCSGAREDSLTIFDVFPRYTDFFTLWQKSKSEAACLVLPARSLATKSDRSDFYKLLCTLQQYCINIVHKEMKDGCRKYVDVYISK